MFQFLLAANTSETSPATGSEVLELAKAKNPSILWNMLSEKFTDFYNNLPNLAASVVWAAIKVLVILIICRIVLSFISGITGRQIQKFKTGPETIKSRRNISMLSLTRSAARYLVYLIAIILILYAINLGNVVTTALAGAGIGALAIGFGAQSLVKDVVSGLFIIFENQYGVGDYVKIDSYTGVVEATALRVTYLRALNGDQIIVPNGQITSVTNYTTSKNTATIDIPTPYETDTRMIMGVIDQSLSSFAEENSELITDIPINLGVNELTEYAVVIRVICNCEIFKQWDVERGIRLYVKEAFEASGISFPYPHRIVSQAEQDAPVKKKNPISIQKEPVQKATNRTYHSPWKDGKITLGDDDAE